MVFYSVCCDLNGGRERWREKDIKWNWHEAVGYDRFDIEFLGYLVNSKGGEKREEQVRSIGGRALINSKKEFLE